MNIEHNFFDSIESNYDIDKQKFINHMNFLKGMTVESQTFYKKWCEMQTYKDCINKAAQVKAKIWIPSDINNEELTIKEIQSLNPTIKYVESDSDENDWLMLRIFCHTMEFSQTPGRFLKFLITDGGIDNPRYLGAVSISSDVLCITVRDNFIGWTNDNRLKDKKINNSAIGSCIMATQPFGYNFLGGKLVACLITTNVVRDIWKRLYNNTLVGMTTTSLYGAYSMYDRIPWWKFCGESAGKICIKPDDVFYKQWHDYVKIEHKDKYDKMLTQKEGVGGPVTGAKQRVISLIFSELGIKSSDYSHGFQRGTYYSCFYDNTKEYLCNKIGESDLKLKSLINGGKPEILNWWKIKAINRYKKLKLENRLKPEILFYNKMMDMTYEDAVTLYLNDVGR